MGVEELTEEPFPVDEDLTVQQLVDIYGKEAVRRGLSYIINLQSADESYRQAANPEKSQEFIQKTAEGVAEVEPGQEIDPEELPESAKEAQSEWEKQMEEKGLGLEDDG